MNWAVRRVAASILLGAVTTGVVAWGLAIRAVPLQGPVVLALWNPPWTESEPVVTAWWSLGTERRVLGEGKSGSTRVWQPEDMAREYSDFACLKLAECTKDGTFPAWWGGVPDDRPRSPTLLWAGATQEARGWPLPALWCEWPVLYGFDPSGGELPFDAGVEGGLDLTLPLGTTPGAGPHRTLPYRPVWWGLGADAIFFGVPWFGVLSLASVRRWLRVRRGLCANCAYDLAGNNTGVCPECGETIVAAIPR